MMPPRMVAAPTANRQGPARYSAYGTMPGGPPIWLEPKPPRAYLNYSFDMTPALTDPETGAVDEPVHVTVSIKPSGNGEIILSALSVSDLRIIWWASDGIPGRTYTISILCMTESELVHEWNVGQTCDGLLAIYPLPLAENPSFSDPLVWSKGDLMPVPMLRSVTVVATGTSQLTAAPIPLAKVLVNAGAGGGVCLPPSSIFGGQTMPVFNRSGGVIKIYPHSGDTIESNGANAGVTLQDEQTGHFSVANSGLLILS